MPSGTIRISRIDTLWNATGSTPNPFDWSVASSYAAALVPQPDGSFQSLPGTAGANGAFEIPNVPAGYYWLKLGPRDIYWTSSSTFDMGGDFFVPTTNVIEPTTSTSTITFNYTSLDPTPTSGLLQFDNLGSGGLRYWGSTTAGFTTFTGALIFSSNVDYSVINKAFVTQYEPASFGPVAGYVLGPELSLSNVMLTMGAPNTISGTLNPRVPASINLSVQGSAWAHLSDHIASTVPATTGGFYLSAQPYIAADGPNVSLADQIYLIWTKSNSFFGFASLTSPDCSQNPPFTTDVAAATVQYSDPFPAGWRRTFHVCQGASVSVPVPGGQTQSINLTNTQTTSLPTATVQPLLSAVQNAKINGADLFAAGTIGSAAVTLTWDPPAIGTPIGYEVSIMSQTTLPNGAVNYVSTTTLSTAKTSMTLLPNVLTSGKTYLFLIISVADGKTNMETSPHRSALPSASAQLLSAPVTITN